MRVPRSTQRYAYPETPGSDKRTSFRTENTKFIEVGVRIGYVRLCYIGRIAPLWGRGRLRAPCGGVSGESRTTQNPPRCVRSDSASILPLRPRALPCQA